MKSPTSDTAHREIVITRVFNAPRETVFHAFTDPKHVDQWYGPRGFKTSTIDMNVRVGGVWNYVMRHEEHGEFRNRVRYNEVVCPERLQYTHDSGVDGDPSAFEVTVLFEAQGNSTKVTMRSVFPTVAEFERVKGFGAVEGGQQTLERLAERLAGGGPKLRVHAFSLSIDGYGAGPNQSLDNPLGVGGVALHEWVFATRTFRKMFGGDDGTTGVDDDYAARGFSNIGAWIIGRNMFGPVRGSWPDDSWKGWWGDDPPYHVPVFVLTHHPRAPITMAGGTTFHFVTDGIHAALKRATEAAGGQDVRLGGGVATIQQYFRAGLVDEAHLTISPVLLGSGEPMFSGFDMLSLGYRCTEHVSTPNATHVVLTRPR